MGSHHELDICSGCGKVRRMHGTGLVGCTSFSPAGDAVEAAAAIEASRATQERSERLWNALRRAVRDRRLPDVHAAVQQLREDDEQ